MYSRCFGKAPAAPADSAAALVRSSSLAVPEPLRSRSCGNFERVRNPAWGPDGGRPGASGAVALRSGRLIRPKGRGTVPRDGAGVPLPADRIPALSPEELRRRHGIAGAVGLVLSCRKPAWFPE